MSSTNTHEFSADIERLANRIDELIDLVTHLKQENRSLLQRQETLVGERAELIDKTEMARTQVEGMINRLKTLEGSA